MKSLPKKALAVAVAAGIAFPMSAFATNGYFLEGFGAKSRGMGGVGVAYGTDALAAAANPATMADVEMNTMRIDVGGEFFNPPRAMRHDSAALGNTAEKSGSNLFLIPSMGGIYKFNRKITVGMAAIGAGFNTRYDQTVRDANGVDICNDGDPGTNGSKFYNFNCNADSNTVGMQLMQMQMLPSVAYKINKQHTIGASMAIAIQTFRAYGFGAFESLGFAGSTENVSGEGNDWSYGGGARLGWLSSFDKGRFKVGLNYASRVYMKPFEKYNNLFAEDGDFDIPSHYAIGIAYKVDPKWTVAADVQRINYGEIESVSNPGPNVVDINDLNPQCPGADTPECLLGGDKGMGMGWESMTVYKLGLNYDYNTEWSFRGGVNYGKAPIPEDQVLFNLVAPATTEKHFMLGASYRPSPNVEWSFNYVHAFKNTIKGPTAFPPAGNAGQAVAGENGAISMYINTLGVSFAYKM
ncbi:MAG: outer membrane protein transport protein [Gammaproteobacteria bacterium]|nr:outer membrane protein transport protein [Gammaproteobacteria bacterium]